MDVLKFVPFSSRLDPGFWSELFRHKLEIYKTDEGPFLVYASYESVHGAGNVGCYFSLDYEAFTEASESHLSSRAYDVCGDLYVFNTTIAFKECKQQALLNSVGLKILQTVESKEYFKNPLKLLQFLCLTYVDLKKYRAVYWFGFPVFETLTFYLNSPVSRIFTKFSSNQLNDLMMNIDEYLALHKKSSPAVFIIVEKDDNFIIKSFESLYVYLPSLDTGKWYLCFVDPSNWPKYPGWPLRNILFALSCTHGKEMNGKPINIIALRDIWTAGGRSIGESLYIEAILPTNVSIESLKKNICCLGWEHDDAGKTMPRSVNLSHQMNPEKIADNALDLNLQLMKWRLVPSLNLKIIKNSKYLLLGAGTLGCSVARCLLSWGASHITFVDNATVSYSNPVRQSLYTFEHSKSGRTSKAQAAVSSLKMIHPTVKSSAVNMFIPMIGHIIPTAAVETTRDEINQIIELVKDHDVIFLLMDTRESRWLPTLLGYAYNKIVINAAIGFDTWLVMRHGTRNLQNISPYSDDSSVATVDLSATDISFTSDSISSKEDTLDVDAWRSNFVSSDKLGCYFCSDVMTPTNSTVNRALDQQCTITRPGVAMMASALAVELAISLLQHPKKNEAPAPKSTKGFDIQLDQNILGVIPHSVRGFLANYQQMTPTTEAFSKCSACSPMVLRAFEKRGFSFLLEVFNDTEALKKLTGLDELEKSCHVSETIAVSDDEEMEYVNIT